MRHPPPWSLPLLLLLGGAVFFGCAAPVHVGIPIAPQGEEKEPPLGRLLSLQLTSAGEPLRLKAVVGRVTMLCVLDGSEAAVAEACSEAQLRWRDRLTVLGLQTGRSLPEGAAAFRVYEDPDGLELKAVLALGPGPAVILTDHRGRVARVLGLADLAELDRSITLLVG